MTFLGTSSAVPTARRNHPATLLQYRGEVILFDCGEGTQRQFRKAKISVGKITKILISHWHGDHILGLPGLLQTMKMLGLEKGIDIYGPKGTKEKMRIYADLFLGKNFGMEIRVYEVGDGVFFDGGDFYLESLAMDHGAPTNAYSFIIKEKKRIDKEKLVKLKLPNSPLIGELLKGKTVSINGKKIDGKKLVFVEPSKKVTVIIDSRYCENAVRLSKEADLLICEASFAKDDFEIAKEYGHMTSVEAATIAKKTKVKKLALNHLSQRYDMIPKKILEEAKKIFKNVFVPEDLDRIEL